MHLTEEEYRRLLDNGKPKFSEPKKQAVKAKAVAILEPYKSKLEASYAQHLEWRRIRLEVESWTYEPMRFILARKTSYTPDFLLIMPDGTIELHEVKGRPREDSWVKWKMAAHMFPWFVWRWVTRKRKEWIVETYGRGQS